MDIRECMEKAPAILMEGALGERLKREYGLTFDKNVDMGAMVYQPEAKKALKELWDGYIEISKRYDLPFLATTTTRRTNKSRVYRGKYDESIIKDNVDYLRSIAEKSGITMYVGGLMGCAGDAYTGKDCLPESKAKEFHCWEAELFRKADVDFLYAAIIPTLEEAAGIAAAASETEIPYIISFTIQRDGRLIDGTPISEAIEYIDGNTENIPMCYMTNCVHPGIAYEALTKDINRCRSVRNRFKGIQGNTSALSYAELDGAEDLKTSDPVQFAEEMARLREICDIKIFGGCCGTDQRHMEEIARRLKGEA